MGRGSERCELFCRWRWPLSLKRFIRMSPLYLVGGACETPAPEVDAQRVGCSRRLSGSPDSRHCFPGLFDGIYPQKGRRLVAGHSDTQSRGIKNCRRAPFAQAVWAPVRKAYQPGLSWRGRFGFVYLRTIQTFGRMAGGSRKVRRFLSTQALPQSGGCCDLDFWRGLAAFIRIKGGRVTGSRVVIQVRRKDGFALLGNVEVVRVMPDS